MREGASRLEEETEDEEEREEEETWEERLAEEVEEGRGREAETETTVDEVGASVSLSNNSVFWMSFAICCT